MGVNFLSLTPADPQGQLIPWVLASVNVNNIIGRLGLSHELQLGDWGPLEPWGCSSPTLVLGIEP